PYSIINAASFLLQTPFSFPSCNYSKSFLSQRSFQPWSHIPSNGSQTDQRCCLNLSHFFILSLYLIIIHITSSLFRISSFHRCGTRVLPHTIWKWNRWSICFCIMSHPYLIILYFIINKIAFQGRSSGIYHWRKSCLFYLFTERFRNAGYIFSSCF